MALEAPETVALLVQVHLDKDLPRRLEQPPPAPLLLQQPQK
jgi:hypothetical protein